MPNFIVVALVLAGAAALSMVLHGGSRGRPQPALRFARRVGLTLDESVRDEVATRLGARQRAAGLAGALAGLLALLAIRIFAAPATSYLWVFVVLISYFAGHSIGLGVVAWREGSRPVPPERPRVARATTPGLGDYVAGHERWGAWVGTACAVVLSVLTMVGIQVGAVPDEPLIWAVAAACLVVPLLLAVVGAVVTRRVLDQPQVATTPLELAWSDALRSQLLRDVITVPLVTGVWASLVVVAIVAEHLEGGWPANPAVGVTAGFMFLFVLGGGTMALVSLALNPAGHFRRRLWPDVDPGGVARSADGPPDARPHGPGARP